jgi:hypothetical protein
MPRKSIDFPKELYKEIERQRGAKISETSKGLSFSSFIVQLVEKALGWKAPGPKIKGGS